MKTAHRVVRSIRRILPAELPTIRDLDGTERAATEAELLNMDLVCINATENLYSCADQDHLIDGVWVRQGIASPGIELSSGFLEGRHERLPEDLKGKVLRASVIRSKDPKFPADDLASASLLEAAGAAEAAVGTIDGQALLDVSDPELLVAEAQRLLDLPDSTLEREVVPMEDAAQGDVIEVENLYPHSWAGESAEIALNYLSAKR